MFAPIKHIDKAVLIALVLIAFGLGTAFGSYATYSVVWGDAHEEGRRSGAQETRKMCEANDARRKQVEAERDRDAAQEAYRAALADQEYHRANARAAEEALNAYRDELAGLAAAGNAPVLDVAPEDTPGRADCPRGPGRGATRVDIERLRANHFKRD
jgi:hypothetical protein